VKGDIEKRGAGNTRENGGENLKEKVHEAGRE
jgi:hypothetical protein